MCPGCGSDHGDHLTRQQEFILYQTAQMLAAVAESIAGLASLPDAAREMVLRTLRSQGVQFANGRLPDNGVLLAATHAELANAIERIAEIAHAH